MATFNMAISQTVIIIAVVVISFILGYYTYNLLSSQIGLLKNDVNRLQNIVYAYNMNKAVLPPAPPTRYESDSETESDSESDDDQNMVVEVVPESEIDTLIDVNGEFIHEASEEEEEEDEYDPDIPNVDTFVVNTPPAAPVQKRHIIDDDPIEYVTPIKLEPHPPKVYEEVVPTILPDVLPVHIQPEEVIIKEVMQEAVKQEEEVMKEEVIQEEIKQENVQEEVIQEEKVKQEEIKQEEPQVIPDMINFNTPIMDPIMDNNIKKLESQVTIEDGSEESEVNVESVDVESVDVESVDVEEFTESSDDESDEDEEDMRPPSEILAEYDLNDLSFTVLQDLGTLCNLKPNIPKNFLKIILKKLQNNLAVDEKYFIPKRR